MEQLSGVHGWLDLILHSLGLHTLWPESFFSINGVFWTIAIEIHFYLAYLLFANRPARFRMAAFLLVMALGIYGVLSKVLPPANSWRIVGQELFLTSFWQWYLGAILANQLVRLPFEAPKTLLWIVRLAFLATSLGLGLTDPTLFQLHLTYWVLPVLAGGVVASFAVKPVHAPGLNPLSRAMSFLGRISYSLYLLHPVALALVAVGAKLLPVPAWVGSTMALGASVLLAWMGYNLIERPSLAWRRRQLSTVETQPPDHLADVAT